MYLDVFDRNPYGTNCWLLAAEGAEEAVVVDPGFEPGVVRAMLEAAGKEPVAALLTHGHVDHAAAAAAFAGSEVPVYLHPGDVPVFRDPAAWGSASTPVLREPADLRTMVDGDILDLAGVRVRVLHTPGHTPGSCCFVVGDDVLVFSGDLVFAGSIGRSDFPESDPAAMGASLERFLELPDALRTLPGHGPETTVGRERATNPFLLELR
jgi:glyoxylase-like metal-dependent hydrolase (beta-lactamase superfamily II)